MAENKEHSFVPGWDGAARTWRRYTREVLWFVQSTPVHKRRYCASRLLSRLSGPARLLAMSWSRMAFDSGDGVRLLLQRLAASPLVRRTLPNTAAICQQYFSFRRNPNESIGNFLVRETLVHEEFVEAIIRLHEEKVGIAQDARDFGLPKEEKDSWDDETWGQWWSTDHWQDDDRQAAGDVDSSPATEQPVAGDGPDGRDSAPAGQPVEQLVLLLATDTMPKLLQDYMGADRPAKRMPLAMGPKCRQRWMSCPLQTPSSWMFFVVGGFSKLQG